jgi:hypothetical protein
MRIYINIRYFEIPQHYVGLSTSIVCFSVVLAHLVHVGLSTSIVYFPVVFGSPCSRGGIENLLIHHQMRRSKPADLRGE